MILSSLLQGRQIELPRDFLILWDTFEDNIARAYGPGTLNLGSFRPVFAAS